MAFRFGSSYAFLFMLRISRARFFSRGEKIKMRQRIFEGIAAFAVRIGRNKQNDFPLNISQKFIPHLRCKTIKSK